MAGGIYLKELELTTRECEVEKIGKFTFKIILTQGVNRQIRRMCKTLGYNVVILKRIRILNLYLNDLEIGKWRYFDEKELY